MERAASVLVLAGDQDSFERLIEMKSPTTEYGTLHAYTDLVTQPLGERLNQIIGSYTHELKWRDWSAEFDLREMNEDEIIAQITSTADVLNNMYQEIDENRNVLWDAREVRDTLGDLEIGLSRFLFATDHV